MGHSYAEWEATFPLTVGNDQSALKENTFREQEKNHPHRQYLKAWGGRVFGRILLLGSWKKCRSQVQRKVWRLIRKHHQKCGGVFMKQEVHHCSESKLCFRRGWSCEHANRKSEGTKNQKGRAILNVMVVGTEKRAAKGPKANNSAGQGERMLGKRCLPSYTREMRFEESKKIGSRPCMSLPQHQCERTFPSNTSIQGEIPFPTIKNNAKERKDASMDVREKEQAFGSRRCKATERKAGRGSSPRLERKSFGDETALPFSTQDHRADSQR